MANVMDTSELISSVKKRASIPTNQKLFDDATFREILNEEMNTYVIPYLMEQHEEFLVNFVDLPLVAGKTHYTIPYRAVGNKIREVVYRDSNGNYGEISRISMEDLEDFQNLNDVRSNGVFYIENNHIVLMSNTEADGSLRVYYYLQPNDLVATIDGEIVSTIYNPTLKLSARSNTFAGSTPLTTNPTFTAGVGEDIGATNELTITAHGLGTGAKLQLTTGGTLPTGLSLLTDYWVINIDANTIKLATSFALAVAGTATPITVDTGLGSVTLGMITGVIVTDSTFPTTFTATSKFDIISHRSPNVIHNYDITPVDFDSTNKIITFPVLDIDISAEANDYFYLSNQSPVPQLPAELHPLLAQAATVYCLEAMGDMENLNMAQRKLGIMEKNLRGILNNRTEGSPKKVTNRNGILYDSVRTPRRGF